MTLTAFWDRLDKELYGLVNYDKEIINSFDFDDDTKIFLMEAGLPESCPPYLTFKSSADGGGLRMTDKYEGVDLSFSKSIFLGFMGNGNPICLNEISGKVIYIDYTENNKEVFVNSSLQQLAESLLVYIDFINEIKKENGRKAFAERKASASSLNMICKRILAVDNIALDEDSFWHEEISYYPESG
jgi:hypothetical protein